MEKVVHQQPVVIGGTVMDLKGRPEQNLQLYTSNPGSLQQTPGGVGRNIAENLVRLGESPFLISAVGSDLTGDALLQHCQSNELTTDGLVQLESEHSAIYLAILDANGDLHTAIADMGIFRQLTPERIELFAERLTTASIVVLDANLPVATIRWVCQFCHEQQIPLWIEPVSVEKSRKITDFLSSITYISPNKEELESLTSITIRTNNDIESGIQILLDQGIDYVLVTLGEEGVLLGDASGFHHFPARPAQVSDVTGAGDSFVAGTVYGLLQDLSIHQAIPYGLAVAKLTVETEDTVYQNLNHQLLKQILTKEE